MQNFDDYDLSVDQMIALEQVKALRAIATSIAEAHPYPMDLSVGRPLQQVANALGDVATSVGEAVTELANAVDRTTDK